MCSGWVHARKTSARGASIRRETTSSRSALVLAATLLLLALQLLQVVFEAIEALLPEDAILIEPVGRVLERTRFEAAGTELGIAAATDQAGTFQDLQMLGDCRKAHVEWLGQLVDRGFAAGEAREYGAARGVSEGGEGLVEAGWRHFIISLMVN